jgi:hypothetical protein
MSALLSPVVTACYGSRLAPPHNRNPGGTNMSENDSKRDNLPNADITRRTIFTLATAVATFGVALGVRASTASAEPADMFLKKEKNKKAGGTSKKNEKQEYYKKDQGNGK